MATSLQNGQYGPRYIGDLPPAVYRVDSVTGDVTEFGTADNGIANTITGCRWLKLVHPGCQHPGHGEGVYLSHAEAMAAGVELRDRYARGRRESREAYVAAFLETMKPYSEDALDAGLTDLRELAEKRFADECATFPTSAAAVACALDIVSAREFVPNAPPCPDSTDGRHDWRPLSHEESQCRHCGSVRFVPDM